MYTCIKNLTRFKQLKNEYKTQLRLIMVQVYFLVLTFVIVSNIKLQHNPKVLLGIKSKKLQKIFQWHLQIKLRIISNTWELFYRFFFFKTRTNCYLLCLWCCASNLLKLCYLCKSTIRTSIFVKIYDFRLKNEYPHGFIPAKFS